MQWNLQYQIFIKTANMHPMIRTLRVLFAKSYLLNRIWCESAIIGQQLINPLHKVFYDHWPQTAKSAMFEQGNRWGINDVEMLHIICLCFTGVWFISLSFRSSVSSLFRHLSCLTMYGEPSVSFFIYFTVGCWALSTWA